MLVSVSFYFRADRFLEDLENKEVNRELCALVVDEMFESWSPEIQEQVLAEWNDWQHSPDKSGYVCHQCGKGFTRSHDLKRHIQSLHSDVKEFTCDKCEKSFATRDILHRHKRINERKRTYECHKCHKKFDRKVCLYSLNLNSLYFV